MSTTQAIREYTVGDKSRITMNLAFLGFIVSCVSIGTMLYFKLDSGVSTQKESLQAQITENKTTKEQLELVKERAEKRDAEMAIFRKDMHDMSVSIQKMNECSDKWSIEVNKLSTAVEVSNKSQEFTNRRLDDAIGEMRRLKP